MKPKKKIRRKKVHKIYIIHKNQNKQLVFFLRVILAA